MTVGAWRARTLRRRAAWPSHLDGLGAAIIAALHVELDRLAVGQAAEPVRDDARLRGQHRVSLGRQNRDRCARHWGWKRDIGPQASKPPADISDMDSPEAALPPAAHLVDEQVLTAIVGRDEPAGARQKSAPVALNLGPGHAAAENVNGRPIRQQRGLTRSPLWH